MQQQVAVWMINEWAGGNYVGFRFLHIAATCFGMKSSEEASWFTLQNPEGSAGSAGTWCLRKQERGWNTGQFGDLFSSLIRNGSFISAELV